jgi:hypothetical protein
MCGMALDLLDRVETAASISRKREDTIPPVIFLLLLTSATLVLDCKWGDTT